MAGKAEATKAPQETPKKTKKSGIISPDNLTYQ